VAGVGFLDGPGLDDGLVALGIDDQDFGVNGVHIASF
jgi:hypothetical protein